MPAETHEIATLRSRAASGDVAAQVCLGEALLNDPRAPAKAEAYRLFSRAASAGRVDGMYWKARCLLEGQGTIANTRAGLTLLRAAATAARPHPQAMTQLAVLALESESRVCSAEEVFSLATRALMLGDAAAHTVLARCYAHGVGVRQDYRQAHAHAAEAALTSGSPAALAFLEEVSARLRATQGAH